MNLNHYLKRSKEVHYAIGHFNFSTEDVLEAIVAGAKEAQAPAVMVGTSEGEADFIGLKEAVALVKVMREKYNFPIFLNADHFKSFDKCKQAIDAGYDSIIIDASALPNIENIELTKKAVDYARSINPDISVEGELGYLRGASKMQDKVSISPADYTQPEEVKDFVQQTGVDRMAVVFGNIHGIVTEQEEKLDMDHFSRIYMTAPDIFYVLHGASGLKDEDITVAIESGISNIHYNTELRVAYRRGIEQVLESDANETTPYKYLRAGAAEVKEVVLAKTKLFMKNARALI